jgi:hypothetical protein
MPPLRVLTIAQKLSDSTLSRLRQRFPVVHYHPHPQTLPASAAAETDVIFCSGAGLPPNVLSVGSGSSSTEGTEQGSGGEKGEGVVLGRVRHVQLASAGANRLLEHPAIKRYAAAAAGTAGGNGVGNEEEVSKGKAGWSISTASGTHVLSIPPWVVGQLIGCWHQFSRMYDIQRVRPLTSLSFPISCITGSHRVRSRLVSTGRAYDAACPPTEGSDRAAHTR